MIRTNDGDTGTGKIVRQQQIKKDFSFIVQRGIQKYEMDTERRSNSCAWRVQQTKFINKLYRWL